LFDRQIGGAGAFEDFIDVGRGTPVQVRAVYAIRNQAADIEIPGGETSTAAGFLQ
jgi:hypothetical protein